MSSVLLCSCFLRFLASFLLSLKRSLHLARRSKKNHLGKNVRRHPGVQQADKQESWRRSERLRGVRLCVWERKQQAGDGHRRPLLGKGRSTHSLSLSLWLALSLPPTPPLSLFWFCVNASSASLAVSLPISLPLSDWSSEVCEMWINWQNLSFSLHKWNH